MAVENLVGFDGLLTFTKLLILIDLIIIAQNRVYLQEISEL